MQGLNAPETALFILAVLGREAVTGFSRMRACWLGLAFACLFKASWPAYGHSQIKIVMKR